MGNSPVNAAIASDLQNAEQTKHDCNTNAPEKLEGIAKFTTLLTPKMAEPFQKVQGIEGNNQKLVYNIGASAKNLDHALSFEVLPERGVRVQLATPENHNCFSLDINPANSNDLGQTLAKEILNPQLGTERVPMRGLGEAAFTELQKAGYEYRKNATNVENLSYRSQTKNGKLAKISTKFQLEGHTVELSASVDKPGSIDVEISRGSAGIPSATLSASNGEEFSTKLGAVLDQTISTNEAGYTGPRSKIPNIARNAFEVLSRVNK